MLKNFFMHAKSLLGILIFCGLSTFVIRWNFTHLLPPINSSSHPVTYIVSRTGMNFLILIEILLLLFLFLYFMRRLRFKALGIWIRPRLAFSYWIKGAMLAIIPTLLALGIDAWMHSPHYAFRLTSGEEAGTIILLLIVGTLFEAAYEEIVFRSGLLVVLANAFGENRAVLIGALIFGLGHLFNSHVNILDSLNMVLLGIVCGYAFIKTRVIWFSVGIHWGFNMMIELTKSNLLYHIIFPQDPLFARHDLISTIGLSVSLCLLFFILFQFLKDCSEHKKKIQLV